MERIDNTKLTDTGLSEQLINLYLNVPTKGEIDNYISENLLSAGLSETQLTMIREQLANHGYELQGKEDLEKYLQSKIMSHLNLSDAHAKNLLSIFNKSLSGYLIRKAKERETALLRLNNEVAAHNTIKRLDILKREVEERIETNKKSLTEYLQTTSGNICTTYLADATQRFLKTDMSADFTKNDDTIKRFLKGDTNAIIDL